MIEKYGRDVISYYLARGRTPDHLSHAPLPSPREAWEIVERLLFDTRASLAKDMIFNHGLSSRQLARLLHSVPEKHKLSGGVVSYFIVHLLVDEQDRNMHEEVCASLLSGYSHPANFDLMETIFSGDSLKLKNESGPWLPSDTFHQAMLEHISKSKMMGNKLFLADIFINRDFMFSPEILSKYVERLDFESSQSLLLDLHSHGRLVSEHALDGGNGRSYLDVFIDHMGLEHVTQSLILLLHTITDLNPNALATAENMIARLGGNQFLKRYFDEKPKEGLKLAAVLMTRENSADDYPALRSLMLSRWNKVLKKANTVRIRLTPDAYKSLFRNSAQLICSESEYQVLPLIELALKEGGYDGNNALNEFLDYMIFVKNPINCISGTIQGIGPERFSKMVNLTGDQSRLLPGLFPNHSGKELSRLFPAYKRQSIESDLGL